MNKAIEEILQLTSGKKLITIAETTHWSESSHVFQFNLFKQLLSAKPTLRFSTERLGLIDAMLMNAWLDGRISIELDELYRDVLLFGGLGTYRFMEYFKTMKTQGVTFRLVGCEVDVLKIKSRTVEFLALFTTKKFHKQLEMYFSSDQPLPKSNCKLSQHLDVAMLDQRNKPGGGGMEYRYKIWHECIVKNLPLFVVGFHLSTKELPMDVPMLTMGMAAVKKEMPGYNTTQFAGFDINNTEHKIMLMKQPKTDIVNMQDYIEPTDFEKKHKTYKLVVPQSGDRFLPRGAAIIPYAPGIKTHAQGRDATDYDAIVFIPTSKFNIKMYM